MDVNPFESPQSPMRQSKLIPDEGLACTYELSPDLLAEIHWKQNAVFYWILRIVSAFVGFTLVAASLLSISTGEEPLFGIVGAVLAVGSGLAAYGVYCRQFLNTINRKHYETRAQAAGTCMLALNQETIQYAERTITIVVPWSRVASGRYNGHLLLITPSDGPPFYIPLDRLTADVSDCLETLLPR